MRLKKRRAYTTPAGVVYDLYMDMLKQPHLLIAGATGSGKSVVINGMLHTALYSSPAAVKFILLDPKRVELARYRNLPHTLHYASEPVELIQSLRYAMQLTDSRYKEMQRAGVLKYQGSQVYVVIDELADLLTTNRKEAAPLIQRLCQVGRAAGVHVIAATQCPISAVIPTPIKVNFDARLGLRTRSRQDSRNILDLPGCECLPRYGQGYYMTPEGLQLYNIPMISEQEAARILKYWRG